MVKNLIKYLDHNVKVETTCGRTIQGKVFGYIGGNDTDTGNPEIDVESNGTFYNLPMEDIVSIETID